MMRVLVTARGRPMFLPTIFIVLSFWHSAAHATLGYFWQITDVHLDLNLSTNGNRDKVCWRQNGNHRSSEGRFGDYDPRLDRESRISSSGVFEESVAHYSGVVSQSEAEMDWSEAERSDNDDEEQEESWIKYMDCCRQQGLKMASMSPNIINNTIKLFRSCDPTELSSTLKIPKDELKMLEKLWEHVGTSLESKIQLHYSLSPSTLKAKKNIPVPVAALSNSQEIDKTYSIERLTRGPTAKKRRLATKEKKKDKVKGKIPKIGISNTALIYMAIKCHPDGQCYSNDITKFALHYFPGLKPFDVALARSIKSSMSTALRDGWLTAQNTEKQKFIWKISSVIPAGLTQWKKCTPIGMKDCEDYRQLLKGKLQRSFDIDGNLVEENTNLPVQEGTNFYLAEIMEELITFKNKSLSRSALEDLIRQEYPDVAKKYANLASNLSTTHRQNPYLVLGEKANGHVGHLVSIVDERKGTPLLTREPEVPPIIFKIIKEAADYRILDNDSGTSWYFFEIDQNGKEITEEQTGATTRVIHARLTKTPGKHKVFVSFFTKKEGTAGETEYAFNFGSSRKKYVTSSHAKNMICVEKAMESESCCPGEAPTKPHCTGPKELYDNDDDDDDDDEYYDKKIWNTNFWDALGLYSATSHPIKMRIRNLLRKLFMNIGNSRGYYRFFSELALQILISLPFDRNANFDPPRGCDSPLALVESAIKAMKKVTDDRIEFILWTGDSVSHAMHGSDHFTDQTVFSVLSNVTSMLKREFPFSNIYPVLGNMDWYPRHGMAPGYDGFHARLARYGQLWAQWVPPESHGTFTKGGYYAIESKDKKPRLLILNTSLYHRKSNKIPLNENDPAGQFKWLKGQLNEAMERSETVYLIGHIPPGNPERYLSNRLGYPSYQDSFTKRYIELVREYHSVIAGQFFGFFHSDSWRTFYKKLDKVKGKFLDRDPISYLFIAPAVSPRKSTMADEIGANNPGIRLYQYNTTSGQIYDYSQYYLNLTEANEQNRDDWKILYNLTSYYNLHNVSAASLSDLAFALNTKDNPLFPKYLYANSVGYGDSKPCDNLCRRTHFCVITNVDQTDYERCIQTVLAAFGSSCRHPPSAFVSIILTLLLSSMAVRWTLITG